MYSTYELNPKQEVDLMVATTSVRPDREMVMDFTIPFYYDTSTLLMKKPDPNEKKLFILAKPLRWEGQPDFQHSFWYMFGALLTQGAESVPKSPSGRIPRPRFWLFSIVLVGTYSGN
uniref:Ionotropic glutamate receptor C-terminal domain-containing protein n=1 Tax=Magallana gigas TaxID=29159 RepID=A0A8W8M928_MAGGI